ncbi:hypothetical protein B0A48_03596 [Cryoendolithus antarcticus]|uniref:Mitochondrial distribution and morphology protein 12 n=1 Tax=Cryoendolithus antarcticus TaxID=1507870 RepID=A0A1V8TKH1_9PEZI|nr:hypothetical protein B0A48_03596 [Cryoendolithus antarcticus]
MSVDINWEALTGGSDGEALAEKIRAFVDDRFQQITLPKLIRSVKVRSFEFGTISPDLAIKDICEPLGDFYGGDEDEDEVSNDQGPAHDQTSQQPELSAQRLQEARQKLKAENLAFRDSNQVGPESIGSAHVSLPTTPGFLHGSSNLGYFNLPLASGFSGTTTPLAAVAGARFQNNANSNTSRPAQRPHGDSFNSISPPPSITPPSRPTSRDDGYFSSQPHVQSTSSHPRTATPPPEPDRSLEDLQIVFHATYSGDVKLALTAEVFLDYPMPSFVGIPLKLNITGVTFDGVGLLAYIKRKAHLCFLAPEDAEALVGSEATTDETIGTTSNSDGNAAIKTHNIGGLIEHIRIESEMGESESGRQVLKNVGKIEKFILEQVQRIFEDEFVYPSFWTILV